MSRMSAFRSSMILACAVGAAVLSSSPALAGRCNTGLISGGFHCGAAGRPDPVNLINRCRPDETPVIYGLDQPFAFDGTTMSTVIMRASAGSPCGADFEKEEPVDGYVLGCWSPPRDDGCRKIRVVNNGTMFLHIKDEPLGCSGKCADVRTGQEAISTAGAADRYICPPSDATTCRSERPSGEERFRLWIGGLCSTNGCDVPDAATPDVATPGANTCTSEWGATLFGYSRGSKGSASPPGFYHWKSGSFNLEVTDGKSTCGQLGECLGKPGNQNPWLLRIVGTPKSQPSCDGDPRNPCNLPPCLEGTNADVCSPDEGSCFK